MVGDTVAPRGDEREEMRVASPCCQTYHFTVCCCLGAALLEWRVRWDLSR